MIHLLLCTDCNRHVRATETSCPFCSAQLDFSQATPPRLISGRFSRTAALALTASLGAVALVDCGSSHPEYGAPSPIPDASAADATDGSAD
jgi:hypothetical protein